MDTPRDLGPGGWLIVAWAVGGTILILVRAMIGLTPKALAAFEIGLSGVQWTVLVAWVAFMFWSEGYRGFQRQFSPRVVVRALHLARNPRPLYVILGPAYVMGLVHGTRRRLLLSWGLVAMIVTFVVLLRFVPQPWRGIADTGVVLGLVYGAATVVWFLWRAIAGQVPDIPPEVPATR